MIKVSPLGRLTTPSRLVLGATHPCLHGFILARVVESEQGPGGASGGKKPTSLGYSREFRDIMMCGFLFLAESSARGSCVSKADGSREPLSPGNVDREA